MQTQSDGRACANAQADYFECLHHQKELKRIQEVQDRKKQLIKEGKYTPPATS